MVAACPHCKKDIGLVSAGELVEEFNISSNQLQHEREQGRFPEPWISFPNRSVYLRSDIEEFISGRVRAKVEETVRDVLGSISTLPESERGEAIKLLEKQLNNK